MTDYCASHELLTLPQALAVVRHVVEPIMEEEDCSCGRALGRVLRRPFTAPVDLPLFDQAAMDGYALRRSDITSEPPYRLRVVGTVRAGQVWKTPLQPGECVRIFTGAALPESADSVVMQEHVERDGEDIVLANATRSYDHIRRAGEDIARGADLFRMPKLLRAIDVSLLAASGVERVPVTRRLRIACMTTGDELAIPGRPLPPGKIYDSNRPLLRGLLTQPAYRVTDLGNVGDDRERLREVLRKATGDHDVIVTTGGASHGDYDLMPPLLAELGEIYFWQIAVKPGKPLLFGRIGKTYVFALPGNPLAVMVAMHHIVIPALRRLCDLPIEPPLQLAATSLDRLKKSPGRLEFQQGVLSWQDDGYIVRSAGGQGSHQLGSASRANAYIVLPAECRGIAPGETVIVEPFCAFETV